MINVQLMQIPLPSFEFLPLSHLALLKDRYLKKMLFKREKPRRSFLFRKTIGLIK